MNIDIYFERLWLLIKEAGTKVASVIGGLLILFIFGLLAFLSVVLFPAVCACALLEWILIPIPYFVITGKRYYESNGLIEKYMNFTDKTFSI